MTATVFKPPHVPFPSAILQGPSVFLAGTIDMGVSYDWQSDVTTILGEKIPSITIFNPRREDWDSSWVQDITDPKFNEQVSWEMDRLERCDAIVMYFGPTSQSPITLLELGLGAAQHPKKLIVCCPKGFWRRGNVQMVCDRYGVVLTDTIEEMTDRAIELLQSPDV